MFLSKSESHAIKPCLCICRKNRKYASKRTIKQTNKALNNTGYKLQELLYWNKYHAHSLD